MKRKLFLMAGMFSIITLISTVEAASVVDFDDLTDGTIYNVGDSFISRGVSMTVESFQWSNGTWFSGGSVPVGNDMNAGGSGNELEWINNANVDFNFGGQVNDISFLFLDGGGNLNIEINGDFRNIDSYNSFGSIDGFTIGGTSIIVSGGVTNFGFAGTLYINGTIDSFAVGGQELNIDNVSYIPEPATIALIAFGIAPAIMKKK